MYFYLAFERQFSDLPFSRSLRHKNQIFHAYVEKEKEEEEKEEEEKEEEEKKLDGTRVVLGCEMRCEAVGS